MRTRTPESRPSTQCQGWSSGLQTERHFGGPSRWRMPHPSQSSWAQGGDAWLLWGLQGLQVVNEARGPIARNIQLPVWRICCFCSRHCLVCIHLYFQHCCWCCRCSHCHCLLLWWQQHKTWKERKRNSKIKNTSSNAMKEDKKGVREGERVCVCVREWRERERKRDWAFLSSPRPGTARLQLLPARGGD